MSNIRSRKYVMVNRPRNGKKLLVLDLDQTLCDRYNTRRSSVSILNRPYLHHFLEEVYRYYDIIIWSATNLLTINHKLNYLGILTDHHYKIMAYLSEVAMTYVRISPTVSIHTKSLRTIWALYPRYNKRNSIIVDDLQRNFHCNKRNGLRIKAFRSRDYDQDMELLYLMRYLCSLRSCDNFTLVNHKRWKRLI